MPTLLKTLGSAVGLVIAALIIGGCDFLTPQVIAANSDEGLFARCRNMTAFSGDSPSELNERGESCLAFVNAVCGPYRSNNLTFALCTNMVIEERYTVHGGQFTSVCRNFAATNLPALVPNGLYTLELSPALFATGYRVMLRDGAASWTPSGVSYFYSTSTSVVVDFRQGPSTNPVYLEIVSEHGDNFFGTCQTVYAIARPGLPTNTRRFVPGEQPPANNPPISQPVQPPPFAEPTPWPRCGDSFCDSSENSTTCPADCGAPPPPPPPPPPGPVCGNATCEAGEDSNICPIDCGAPPPPGPVCGNATCEAGENSETCPFDCGAPPVPVCGNEVCEVGEDSNTCARDCGAGPVPVCGNQLCEEGEDTFTCEADCPAN